MRARLILRYTHDASFDEMLGSALFGAAIVLIARSEADALAIVCRRGHELGSSDRLR
jgi:hypothetical protein